MTKKTRLLTLARRYPFLSVDEIAERVGTTPRYVRTSLSEAGLSLLALRRQQALRMAQDVQVPMAMGAGGGTSAGLTMSTEEVTITDVGMEQRFDPDMANMLHVPADTPLLNVHRLRSAKGVPVYVGELITTRSVIVTDTVFAPDVPLFELLGVDDGAAVSIGKLFVDVPEDFAAYVNTLQMKTKGPILRIGYVLYVEEEPMAVKYHYVDGSRFHVVFSCDPTETIRIVDKPFPAN